MSLGRNVLLLSLLWCLVEVHSQQIFPYVSFMGNTLANHSYVNLSLVGTGSDSVVCHTDLATCCSMPQGSHRGDWFLPNGTRLEFCDALPLCEFRESERVNLIQTGTSPSGVYRCHISTDAVHGDDSSVRESLYVGLYPSGGNVTLSGIVFTEVSDINGNSPQFTLTCISTGGPATTVTWTRDSATVTGGTETVLNDPETAQYTHTLTVTGRLPGFYTCSVANNKPSNDSAGAILSVPTGAPEMFVAVAGERAVEFSWSTPPPSQQNGDIISYTLSLSCSPSPSSLPQSPPRSGSLLVASFSPGTSYSCSLVAINIWGTGPPATVMFTTEEDYTYFQLLLKGVLPCSELIATLAEQRLEDITTEVMAQLGACAECNDVIDKQSLSCSEETPSFVTYRARLEGTSETDSGSLISLIEQWVRGGASVIVTGILMTVDSDCSVAISHLSEPKCSPNEPSTATESTSPQSSTNYTQAIIGGTVAISAILMISIAIVIGAVVLKIHRHRKSHQNSAVTTSTAVADDAEISTSINSSYGVLRREQNVPTIPRSSEAGPGGEAGLYATVDTLMSIL